MPSDLWPTLSNLSIAAARRLDNNIQLIVKLLVKLLAGLCTILHYRPQKFLNNSPRNIDWNITHPFKDVLALLSKQNISWTCYILTGFQKQSKDFPSLPVFRDGDTRTSDPVSSLITKKLTFLGIPHLVQYFVTNKTNLKEKIALLVLSFIVILMEWSRFDFNLKNLFKKVLNE